MPSTPPLLFLAVALSTAVVVAPAAEAPNAVTINSAEEITAAALAQIRGQDRLIQQLKAATSQQQARVDELQAQLARAEAGNARQPWLLAALAVVAAAAAGLAYGLGRRQGGHSAAMPGIRGAAPGTPPPVGSRLQSTPPSGPSPLPDGPAPGGLPLLGSPTTLAGLAPLTSPPPARLPVEPVAPTQSLTAARAPAALSLGTGVQPREVSVEELLDLEQQVDFFVVLGQDEAAIDLLVGHIRATGGTSPLPYLKLLEIYSQRGDEPGYERIRSRFNQRFTAEVPAWGGALNEGRSLEDYAEVVERLQVLWPMPLEALEEIEALMHAQAGAGAFDLPAFRDLLVLHGIAGDLLGQEALVAAEPATQPMLRPSGPVGATAVGASMAASADVDLLLPFDDEEAADTTSPRPWMAMHPVDTPMLMPRPVLDLSAAPDLDLDLSARAPAPREFTQPAAFHDVDLFRDSRRSDFAALDSPPDPSHPQRRSPR